MNIALFDFDGTVTFKDTFIPFIYFAASPRRIALGAVLLPLEGNLGVPECHAQTRRPARASTLLFSCYTEPHVGGLKCCVGDSALRQVMRVTLAVRQPTSVAF